MIWFAPFDGFGDTDPRVPFSRPQAAPLPSIADPSPEQFTCDESPDEPGPTRGDERPPPRASIK